jgi:hypothetical protein
MRVVMRILLVEFSLAWARGAGMSDPPGRMGFST